MIFFTFYISTSISLAQTLTLEFDHSISQIPSNNQQILKDVFKQVESDLPPKFIQVLKGKSIKISSGLLSPHQELPKDLCANNKETQFVFGSFNRFNRVLTLHSAVIKELLKSEKESLQIDCFHKNLFRQSIATIIHELTHAYDFNNGHPSQSIEFRQKAGFKKGIVRVKNKNKEAMRSPDPYELVNLRESFAVNMEYFILDPEFKCRKPSLFQFYAKHFEFSPANHSSCKTGSKVLVSNSLGFYPFELKNSRVYRIDYLLASAGNELMSGFGHSMFRIVICAEKRVDPVTKVEIPATPMGPLCLNDRFHHLVVSFRANVEDSKLNYMKGLTGGYPSMLFILNFPDVLDEYNKDELRDVVSYPLKLNAREKEDFINRIKEDHWNYRGDYKFVTNNCAVESADVFKNALDINRFDQSFSLTPNGVLKDFANADLIQLNDPMIEIFKAHTDDSLFAFEKAYGFKPSLNSKKNKEAFLKFIQNSKVEQRSNSFNAYFQPSSKENLMPQRLPLEVLRRLKSDVVTSSSFSVVEQQIMRSKSLQYRKKAGEFFLDTKDPEILEFIKESKVSGGLKFKDHFFSGYGIPFDSEVISLETIVGRFEESQERIKIAEDLLMKVMPNELRELEKMNHNIKMFNEHSLKLRRLYRQNFESYLVSSLKSLKTGSEAEQTLFHNGLKGYAESIAQIRIRLGNDIVTEKEILDTKLIKIMNQIDELTNR